MSGPEAAFWDLYDKDEKGCEVVYVNSLLARIAELEAENKRLRTRVTATEDDRNQRLDEMRAALAKQSLHVEDCHRQVEQAEAALIYDEDGDKVQTWQAHAKALEAALAERERMLRLLWEQESNAAGWSGSDSLDEWLGDLKARAEEGGTP